MGPLLGASWGPLGDSFWLKSRLKIGDGAPRALLDYFFRSWDTPKLLFFGLGALPGLPEGRPSSTPKGFLERSWPREASRTLLGLFWGLFLADLGPLLGHLFGRHQQVDGLLITDLPGPHQVRTRTRARMSSMPSPPG